MLWWHKKSDVPAIFKPRKESWITPTMVVVGTIPFLTFALGTWQLKRLKWKINLIDELEEKLQLQPLSLPGKLKYVRRSQPGISLTKIVFQLFLSLFTARLC
jgi:surfeit locus 1 family protein